MWTVLAQNALKQTQDIFHSVLQSCQQIQTLESNSSLVEHTKCKGVLYQNHLLKL